VSSCLSRRWHKKPFHYNFQTAVQRFRRAHISRTCFERNSQGWNYVHFRWFFFQIFNPIYFTYWYRYSFFTNKVLLGQKWEATGGPSLQISFAFLVQVMTVILCLTVFLFEMNP